MPVRGKVKEGEPAHVATPATTIHGEGKRKLEGNHTKKKTLPESQTSRVQKKVGLEKITFERQKQYPKKDQGPNKGAG